MANIPELRSPYAKVGRLVYFGRMVDKIRLNAAGKLPADYVSNLGEANPRVFDARCCRFLGVSYADLVAQTLASGAGSSPEDDEKLLAWAHERGTPRSDEECQVWSQFMAKMGWRDAVRTLIDRRVAEGGEVFAGKIIETFFDFLDVEEGRDPAAERLWEKI